MCGAEPAAVRGTGLREVCELVVLPGLSGLVLSMRERSEFVTLRRRSLFCCGAMEGMFPLDGGLDKPCDRAGLACLDGVRSALVPKEFASSPF